MFTIDKIKTEEIEDFEEKCISMSEIFVNTGLVSSSFREIDADVTDPIKIETPETVRCF